MSLRLRLLKNVCSHVRNLLLWLLLLPLLLLSYSRPHLAGDLSLKPHQHTSTCFTPTDMAMTSLKRKLNVSLCYYRDEIRSEKQTFYLQYQHSTCRFEFARKNYCLKC